MYMFSTDEVLYMHSPLLHHLAPIPSHLISSLSVVNNRARTSVASPSPPAPRTRTPPYVTSKATVVQLARNLAVKMAPRHVLVKCIAAGVFPCQMANRGGREGKL